VLDYLALVLAREATEELVTGKEPAFAALAPAGRKGQSRRIGRRGVARALRKVADRLEPAAAG
jgi:hypothetical protein